MKDFNLRNFLVEGKKAKEEKVDEAGPGFMHDCAAHVVHETYGYGICLDGEHTLVENADGTHSVTHYDVFFKEGNKTVKNIPVGDLEVLTESHHGHKKKKNEEEIAEEGETVEEEVVGGLIGAAAIILGSVQLGKLMDYLRKNKPETFKKIHDIVFALGDFTDGRYGGGSGKMTETEDELREERLKKEVEDIIGK